MGTFTTVVDTLDIRGCLLLSDQRTLDLNALLSALCQGARVYSPAVESLLQHQHDPPDSLTDRQKDILYAFVSQPDLTCEAHAERMGISYNTLRGHLKEIYTRLGVSNAMAAVLAALRAGILSLNDSPYHHTECPPPPDH